MSQAKENLQPGLKPEVPGQPGHEEEQQEEQHEGQQEEQRAQALRALLEARNKKAGLGQSHSTAVISEEETVDGSEQLKVSTKKRQLLDSDEEEPEEEDDKSTASESGSSGIPKRKRFQIVEDDSD